MIDTPEVNAFAAPGGYILVTRGLYELLSSDSELAAVLGHEISHCVQRDHYKVIRKQELASVGKDEAVKNVTVGNDSVAGSYARRYAEQHGAAIMSCRSSLHSAVSRRAWRSSTRRTRRWTRGWIASISEGLARWSRTRRGIEYWRRCLVPRWTAGCIIAL